MSSPKRKPATIKAKPKEEVNKKALIWIGSIVGVIVVAVALLLVFTS
ncbi:hypothetical protein [Paenibacillus sp. LHD-38]|nr:hypothetical protein [Paenibacillus sp. LHD-38]MDQ8736764.1 hypothetical protein [Paenibacillus sp. LHD-38]